MKFNKFKAKKIDIYKIMNILLISIFIVLVINLATTKSEKLFEVIGYRSYTVLSGSMEPKFNPGDMVIIKHKNKSDIEVNDIVTFKDNEGIVITHRIVEKIKEGYITKGDNSNVEDADILKSENIIGEVKFSIPKIGFISNHLSNPMVIALEMILLAIFIFFYYKD